VVVETERKSCAFFLKRKNRFCRMTVGEGKKYCGEHMIVAGESEVSACSLKLRNLDHYYFTCIPQITLDHLQYFIRRSSFSNVGRDLL